MGIETLLGNDSKHNAIIVNTFVKIVPKIAAQFQHDYKIRPSLAWEEAAKYEIKCLTKCENRI